MWSYLSVMGQTPHPQTWPFKRSVVQSLKIFLFSPSVNKDFILFIYVEVLKYFSFKTFPETLKKILPTYCKYYLKLFATDTLFGNSLQLDERRKEGRK